MSISDEIKSRLDIVSYIQQYVPLKKAGRTYKACCPFHSEKTPSFHVDPDRQTWRCFGACATGGDIFGFAMRQHGWTFPEALHELGKLAGVQTRNIPPEQAQANQRREKLQGILQAAADFYHAQLSSQAGAQALAYATGKRGFSPQTITRFAVGYAPPGWRNLLEELTTVGYSEADILDCGLAIRSENGRVYDRFRNRLMIPIRDERGRTVGFGARALAPNDNPKYMNSPQSDVFDKSRLLFGLDTARNAIRESGTVVIVEGYMDAIQAQQAGFHNVVAQMGTALTETQLSLVVPRMAHRIILALDSDAAGQNATLRSLEVARQTLAADYTGRLKADIRILQIPGAKDPDDLIRENPDQWQGLIDNAIPIADYVIQTETASLPKNPTIQEREAVARRVLPLLLASESDLYRQENLQRLALRLRIAEADLLAWAQEQKRALATKERPARTRPADATPPPLHSDEPPPLDISGLEAPDGIGQVDDLLAPPAVPNAPAPLPARTVGAELEAQCLRLLLLQPDLLYRINRMFRELAGDDARLAADPLAELSVEDFTHGDYRALIQLLRQAMKQDDLPALDFLRQTVDDDLIAVLDTLLMHEADQLREGLRRRFDGDAIASWKHHERRVLPFVDMDVEALSVALRLRRARLDRDARELHALQTDAQARGEDDIAYASHAALLARAKSAVDQAIRRNLSQY